MRYAGNSARAMPSNINNLGRLNVSDSGIFAVLVPRIYPVLYTKSNTLYNLGQFTLVRKYAVL